MAELERISFIGCGKVGQTLARALKNAGYEIDAILCRRVKNAEKAMEFVGAGRAVDDLAETLENSSVHFICTNDDQIERIVDDLERNGPKDLKAHYFFHTSGSLNSSLLEPLHKKGAEIASIHPLQVFADPAKAVETLPGIYYTIEGSDRAMSLAVQMIDRLHGKLLLIPTGRKVLYHAAGVFAANYLMVLIDFAMGIMEDLGETPEDAYQAFLPLMVGALENVEEFGVDQALTGPVSRGDVATVKKHIEALEQLDPEVSNAYRVLARRAVEIALRSGRINQQTAASLTALLAQ